MILEMRSKIGELELRLKGQEKEMKGQVNKLQELQVQLEKAKAELNEKEKVLNKSRDELVRTTAQHDQASTKVLDFSLVIDNSPFFFIQCFRKSTFLLDL